MCSLFQTYFRRCLPSPSTRHGTRTERSNESFALIFFSLQERSFQKQPTIFLNKKQGAAKASKTGRAERYTRNVGLGFKTPREVSHFSFSPRSHSKSISLGDRRDIYRQKVSLYR